MEISSIEFRGQPALRATGPDGSTLIVALHGAQVLSWTTADAVERLYLSPRAVFDGRAAIRGGVPICCPQFNQRGMLPKHGFMRNLPWVPEAAGAPGALRLVLRASEATVEIWPHAFEARLDVALSPGQLRTALTLSNIDHTAWTFAAALHTYLHVEDIAQVRLEGLQGTNRWDSLRDDRHVETAPAVHFDAEFDSVYAAPAKPLRLVQPGGRTIEIAQSASCSETVVWNPGALLGAKLADMPEDGYRHMVCVEAARIDEPVLLAPGAQWQGWQQLRVL